MNFVFLVLLFFSQPIGASHCDRGLHAFCGHCLVETTTGSERAKRCFDALSYYIPLEKLGGLGINGTTSDKVYNRSYLSYANAPLEKTYGYFVQPSRAKHTISTEEGTFEIDRSTGRCSRTSNYGTKSAFKDALNAVKNYLQEKRKSKQALTNGERSKLASINYYCSEVMKDFNYPSSAVSSFRRLLNGPDVCFADPVLDAGGEKTTAQ